jgi:integrase
MWRHWIKTVAVPELGLPPIRFHDLRHSHATILLERGVALKVIQVRLGHSNIEITSRLYAHVTEKLLASAATAADEAFA